MDSNSDEPTFCLLFDLDMIEYLPPVIDYNALHYLDYYECYITTTRYVTCKSEEYEKVYYLYLRQNILKVEAGTDMTKRILENICVKFVIASDHRCLDRHRSARYPY